MSTSMRNVLIAVVLAIAAATTVVLYTSSVRSSAHQQVRTIQVLVATKDIDAGTDGAKAASSMSLKTIPVDLEVPGAVRSAAGFSGLVATQKIRVGEQVVGDVFQKPIGQDAQIQLKPTERAIEVNMNLTSSAVGTVKAGDSVDLYGTFKVQDSQGREHRITRLLVPNVLVLQIPEETKKATGLSASGSDSNADQVTFAVSMDDAPKLAYMAATSDVSTLWMIVRPQDGKAAPQDEKGTIQTVESMVAGDLTAAEIQKRFGNLVAGISSSTAAASGSSSSSSSSTTTTPVGG